MKENRFIGHNSYRKKSENDLKFYEQNAKNREHCII